MGAGQAAGLGFHGITDGSNSDKTKCGNLPRLIAITDLSIDDVDQDVTVDF
ncbi:hypothetical protein QZH47_20230 [Pseudomonas corrugata]